MHYSTFLLENGWVLNAERYAVLRPQEGSQGMPAGMEEDFLIDDPLQQATCSLSAQPVAESASAQPVAVSSQGQQQVCQVCLS